MVKQEDVNLLQEMGFPENRARKALAITKSDVQAAMDWLLQHSEDADIDEPLNVAEEQSSSADPNAVAKSFKCEECGKILRDSSAVQLHAHRTGHESFAESTDEIKPLTEEEKKEQLARLKEILKQKRAVKAVQESEENITKEKDRRKQGREGKEIQAKFQEQQQQKELEKQRREKEEERLHKERVRAQIEQDKRDKKARLEADKRVANPETTPVPAASPTSASATSSAPTAQKEYTECRIQVRLANNSTLSHTFGAHDQFRAVVQFVEQTISPKFELLTTFPRKVYGPDDYNKTLTELQLVPSSVFICRIV